MLTLMEIEIIVFSDEREASQDTLVGVQARLRDG
jgi:hypothetical protein